MNAHVGFQLLGSGYPILKNSLALTEVNTIEKIFKESVSGGDFLDENDLKVAVVSLFGYKPSKNEVRQILEKYGTLQENIQGLTQSQFVEAMTPKMLSKNEDEDVRETFMAFDSQCRGFLTLDDLKKVTLQTAPHLKPHIVESLFREMDRDGDGRVSYKDFEFLMKFDVSETT